MLRQWKTAVVVAVLAGSAYAQDIEKMTLTDMTLNPHPQFEDVSAAFLTGRFDQEGLYAANSVLGAGAVFPPHHHNDDRLSVVIEGTMYLGTGDTVNPANEQEFPAGSVALTPAGTVHYMVARSGDVRILEIGSGPSATDFSE
ncbi:cupin domain-containing protein [Cognatiyoonia sp. IB215182]|uniref:cupin domain-containing protein n=1 Tax=Cognatiyoonia sp. IB215182 TaxID=3097353 RepID=UPI002A17B0A3|nr:cupin domain-containing protein [Cognatiyoonia sp. IB215182]MDX8354056.1 cupin domain-containing protein [Cognatiyoonia sp. IB215182]